LRTGLNSDLGYSDEDRAENLRRAAHVANMVANLGVIVIAAFVTPTERHRDIVRTILQNDLLMVHVDCPIEICMQRDVKGMYAKAKAGQMEGMTGLQQPFETSRSDVLTIHTDHVTIDQGVSTILKAMNQQKDW
jgi:adenylylsulfate kinase